MTIPIPPSNLQAMNGRTLESWNPERRRAASKTARRRRLWGHSSGPRTPVGKHAQVGNNLKHGHPSRHIERARRMSTRLRRLERALLAQLDEDA